MSVTDAFIKKLRQRVDALGETQQSKTIPGVVFDQEDFLADVRARGGQGTLERVKRYGKTDQGRPVALQNWLEECILLQADWRLQYVATSGAAQTGKAQTLNSKILTRRGWVRMGDMVRGMHVACPRTGLYNEVLAVHPQGETEVYAVTFDDGVTIKTSPEHLWTIESTHQHERNITTELIKIRLEEGKRIQIRAAYPTPRLVPVPLLVTPRAYGRLCSTRLALQSGTYKRNIFRQYSHATRLARLRLLRGVLEGTRAKEFSHYSRIIFNKYCPEFESDVIDLVRGLGGKAILQDSIGRAYRLKLPFRTSDLRVLTDEAVSDDILYERIEEFFTSQATPVYRVVVSVVKIESEPTQCISISGRHRLYITEGHIPTHNTLSNVLVCVDLHIHGRMPIGMAYADLNAMQRFSKMQYRRVASEWIQEIFKQHRVQIESQNDVKQSATWQIGDVTANFAFASTSKMTSKKEGQAILGGSAASFPAAMVCCDERSRYPPSADFTNRTGYSPIRAGTIRDLGTPGSGQGIEKYLAQCHHYFVPHFPCKNPDCSQFGEWLPLDPRGTLLREEMLTDPYGRQQLTYFDSSAKPVKWWCHDPNDAVETAYFGCPACGDELTLEQRTVLPRMRCVNTGIFARELIESLPNNFTSKLKAGIYFSPLCRENSAGLARELVMMGVEADDGEVYQQETLGIPSSGRVNRLTDAILHPLIDAPFPIGVKPYVTVAGVDWGRSTCWVWIMDVHLPGDWRKLSDLRVSELCVRRVRFGGSCHRAEVLQLCQQYNVEVAGVDAFPDTSWSCQLVDDSLGVFSLVSQVGIKDSFKDDDLRAGGDSFNCLKISNQYFYPRVFRNCIAPAYDKTPSYRFPLDWLQWKNRNTSESPLRHFKGPFFDPIGEKWMRPANKDDDIFNAALIAEAMLDQVLAKGIGSVWESDY
jgi:hypothetical protein